ncbi:MAG: ATP synthase F1 subunit gamma [Candidatus Spechtbacterales bacterium]
MAANSTKEIKRRQRSIGNTQKVTRAMEMVSAAKMRKSQLRALAARPYAQHVVTILERLAAVRDDEKEAVKEALRTNPYFASQKGTTTLLVLIASDKGLIGGLNASLIAHAKREIARIREMGQEVEAIAVGAKSATALRKLGVTVVEEFVGVGDYVDLAEITPVTEAIMEHYRADHITRVVALYAEFLSTLKQQPATRQILPASPSQLEGLIEEAIPEEGRFSGTRYASREETQNVSYIFEPSPAQLLDELVPYLISITSYHIILEANASEHSARMIAMRNASTNAERLLEELTLSYNKARQAAITREISEVSSGAEALTTE